MPRMDEAMIKKGTLSIYFHEETDPFHKLYNTDEGIHKFFKINYNTSEESKE